MLVTETALPRLVAARPLFRDRPKCWSRKHSQLLEINRHTCLPGQAKMLVTETLFRFQNAFFSFLPGQAKMLVTETNVFHPIRDQPHPSGTGQNAGHGNCNPRGNKRIAELPGQAKMLVTETVPDRLAKRDRISSGTGQNAGHGNRRDMFHHIRAHLPGQAKMLVTETYRDNRGVGHDTLPGQAKMLVTETNGLR